MTFEISIVLFQPLHAPSQLFNMTTERRHIPYLSFHKNIIRELCRPQKDDLLIIAKGLGLRRVGCEKAGKGTALTT